MKKGFTLIEMMVAIAIFSLVVIMLYRSYDSLQKNSSKYREKQEKMQRLWRLKKTIFLDFSLVLNGEAAVLHQDRNRDILYLHTSNSVHDRINPYVAYVFKGERLYRLESLHDYGPYPFGSDIDADVDMIAKIKKFRIYKALAKQNKQIVTYFLVDISLQSGEEILYKIKALNQS